MVWLKDKLKRGTISEYDSPNKHVSEYVIFDRKFNERLLKNLKPFVVVKKKQLELALEILSLKDKTVNEKSFKPTIKTV